MKVFIDFLIANFVIALFIFVVLNFIVGVAKAWQVKEFSFTKAILGIKDIFLLAIGTIALGLLFYIIQGVQIYGLPFADTTFKLIMTLAIAYYGNSVLQNALPLLKMPTPAFLKTIDDKVKEMFNRTDPVGSYEVPAEEVDTALKDSELYE
jgi:phage-related holin